MDGDYRGAYETTPHGRADAAGGDARVLRLRTGTARGRRTRTPIAQADRAIVDHEAWQDVCDWARTQTEPRALFLTPRSGVSFKWRAERPEVVNYKDIPQSAVDIVEWRRRVRAIYGGVDPYGAPVLVGDLGELGGQHVATVGRKYGADYAIAGAWNPLSLPVAYRNRAYVVYDLRKLPSEE